MAIRKDDENPLSDYAGFLVRRIWQIHVAMFLEESRGSKMTPVQFSILLVLRHDPDMDQVALAFRVGIDRSNLSEILARMTKAGLVKSSRSLTDGRAKISRLTKRGQNLIKKLESKVNRSHSRLLEDLAPDERKAFVKMLKKVVAAKNELGRTKFSMRTAAV
ncbi:MAG: MarR family transcriptional regulator [Bradyrhizobium sp.]|jgi:DNA-binding MarR family transcriptional regulator|nr:MarR family transcriptional regulator [Bradyrhizobium sp.]